MLWLSLTHSPLRHSSREALHLIYNSKQACKELGTFGHPGNCPHKRVWQWEGRGEVGMEGWVQRHYLGCHLAVESTWPKLDPSFWQKTAICLSIEAHTQND